MPWPTGSSAASRPTPCRVQRLRWLNRYFFHELGFAGNVNDYYDPRNSYLQRGARDAARHPDHAGAALRRAGRRRSACTARGVSFPGHFLVKLQMPRGEVVIDPFTGQSLSREELDELLAPYRKRQRAWRATSRCRSACSCRRRRRATCSPACCAT